VRAFALGCHQTGRLQHVEMVRDRLPCQAQAVFHRQPRTQLEQSLSVSLVEFVQNRPSCRRGEALENFSHGEIIGK
jgi:hypothetical protein